MTDEVNVATQNDGDTQQKDVGQSDIIQSSAEGAPDGEQKENKAVELNAEKQKGVDKRIANLTRQLRTAQEKIAQQNAMRQDLSRVNYAKNPTNESQHLIPKPDRNQFADAFDYADAVLRWKDENAMALQQQQQQQMQASQIDTVRRKLNDQHKARALEFKKVVPDFDEAMNVLDGLLPQSHIIVIQKSPYSAEIAYQLAKNVDDATEFSMLDPIEAGIKIGELTSEFKRRPKAEAHQGMASITSANSNVASASSSKPPSKIAELRKRYSKRST